ncbi:MAG: hypothetical protein K2X57_27260 [Xanthobacteraceae bacterium]|nr:hypothetical protein [Xanthobacteraceae bacterium]MBY0611655.1 hypothetical protein [Beijerinckiaceae bacterium]
MRKAGPTAQLSLEFDPERSLLWMTIRPEPKPIFTYGLLDSISKIQNAIIALWGANQAQCPIRFMAYRSTGPVFTLGGDLEFYLDCLARGDLGGLKDYARLSAEGVINNMTGLRGLVVTLATVHGKGLGGGIDASRSCNIMIAEEQATLGYPEIAFNHFPILAAPILSRRIGGFKAQKLLMEGEEFSAQGFYDQGLLDAVVPNGTGEDWVRRYAKSNLGTHSARVTLFNDFLKRGGDAIEEVKAAGELWANYMFGMKPTDISKLQRIAQMQDRMLMRLYRETSDAGEMRKVS